MVKLSLFACLLPALSGALATALPSHNLIKRASLQQVTNSGISNPTNVGFYIYVPDKLAAKPAIIVGIHWCSGSAQAFYSGSPYATLAEKYGYIVIYPSSPWSGSCWDVSSKESLTRNAGGDSTTIASMVNWTIKQYGADASRVYVTGLSSGGMMTNVMAATYPDLFKAAIVYAGVPAGCFVSSTGAQAAWNGTCSSGQSINTPATWATVVKNMAPGYTGPRPKMQIYHGSKDDALLPNNYNETIKQWSGVFGYNYQAPVKVEPNTPGTNMYRETFGDSLQGIRQVGVTHSIQINGTEDMKFFGFEGTTPTYPTSTSSVGSITTTPKPTSSTATSTKPATPTTTSSGGTVPKWGQCGGIGYTGPTQCVAGSTCIKSNDWYSQCL